jgi:hypothetical protein
VTSPRTSPRLTALGLLILGAVLLFPTESSSQAVARFGRGAASLEIPVQLTIPVQLKASATAGERVVEQTPTYTEVELPVTVAANVGWVLNVAIGSASDLGPVLVRSADGEWLELGASSPRAAFSSHEPANAFGVRLRLRLPRGAASTGDLQVRLSIVQADLATR